VHVGREPLRERLREHGRERCDQQQPQEGYRDGNQQRAADAVAADIRRHPDAFEERHRRTVAAVGVFADRDLGEADRRAISGLGDEAPRIVAAQNLLDLAGGATSIEIKVRDPFAAETIAQAIRAGSDLRVDSWISTNAQFFSAMSAQILANTLIRVFVGITVALGIASVLVVSVVQKSKEIGILRAMGSARAQVLRVFLIQGGFMGLTGALFGSLLAWGFLILWRGVAKNPDGTPLFVVLIEPSLFVVACVAAMVVGILAAIVPARRAATLDPAVAIRG
jgi:hypothetical protein